MDANTVWQWRIMRVKKNFLPDPDPFHYCSEIGLEFNVAANTEKKIDLQLVTNGVILEICDFAKTVSKSKRHFITNILENNFDLGLENEQQRVDFTDRILRKVKDLVKIASEDKHEVFALFDTSSEPECANNNGLIVTSTERKTENVMVEMDDNNDNEHDEFKYSQATSEESIRTESCSNELSGAHIDDSKHQDEFSTAHSTKEMEDNVLPPLFPYCKEIGLNLDIGTKQSLDPGLLTKGVMLELLNFTNILTASFSRIVLDVLGHNFELDLKSQQAKNRVLVKISGLQKRRKQLSTIGSNTISEFKNEPFSFQTNPLKRPRKTAALSNMGAKRCKETDTISQHTNLCTSGKAESDGFCTCALGESGLDSDKVLDSGNSGNRDHLQNLINSGISRESESSCVDGFVPFLTTSDISSSLTTLNPNINSPFASQSDRKGLCGGEEQTQTPRNMSNKCDLEQEEMGTEGYLWKLRANRVEEIFSPFNKDLGPFVWSRKIGLEFNIGFGPKRNISVDSLTNVVLLDIARFALAINSSQKDFIMEILEYNFDLGLQNQHHRSIFAFEIMNRVRWLSSCEDAVKSSNDVFELAGPMPMPSVNMANQSVDNVSPELGSTSRMGKCDGAPVCPESHAETEEHISHKSVDLYPSCKEIGLKLHVSYGQSREKLEINKLTNAAMTEVTNFAEKLCGTFEQICLDIIRHNFDLDVQSGDSDIARHILARIPGAVEQRNLYVSSKAYKKRGTRRNITVMEKLDYQDDPSLDACNTGSSQAAIIEQDVSSSSDIKYRNELNLQLWKLRANHIQHILSVPHEEHCPLYSYSRCKKLGIDFNVGSGVKQNLDPKLLTNGIMLELKTFATALVSAKKHFITEILEYNFNLNFNDELCRSAFAQQIFEKIRAIGVQKKRHGRNKMPFELPDIRVIQVSSCDKWTFCPKCYQDRKHKLCQNESNRGHPHTIIDTVSADANSTAQMPKDPFPTVEETIMDGYPECKKIGFNLCVDKDQPKDKLDEQILTRGIVFEVVAFATKLCGATKKLILDLLEHNFSIAIQCQDFDVLTRFCRATTLKDGGLAWLDDVFVIRPVSCKQPRLNKLNEASPMHTSERKEAIRKRKLALQTKEERATLPSHNASVVTPKTNHQSRAHLYPICTEIGLDLDVTAKPKEKEKLNLNLLTTGVVAEIYKFATQKTGHYFPGTVFDILDYNFDLSSQHYRRWEFSLAAASQIQNTVKRWRKKRDGADEVFKLPFVFPPKTSCKKYSQGEPDKKRTEGSCVHQVRYHSDVHHINFLGGVNTVEEPRSHNEDTKSPTDPWRMNDVQMNGCQKSVGCGSPLQGNLQIKKEEYDPQYCDIKAEPDTEEYYHPHYDEVKTESNTGDVEHLVPGAPTGSLGITGYQNPFQNLMSSDITRESRSTCLVICAPFPSTTDISTTLPTVNLIEKIPFAGQAVERGLCGGEEQTQTARNTPNECDLEREERKIWNEYTHCPEEFALNSEEVTDLVNASNRENLKNPTSSNVPRESESSCLVVCVPFPTIINVSSTLLAGNSNVNPLFASQADDRQLCGGEEQKQTLKNASNECDMEQEEIRSGNNYSYPQEEFELISDEDKRNEDSCVHQVRCHSDVHHINDVQMNRSQKSIGCGSPLQGNIQIKKEYDPQYCDIKAEPDTEDYYHPHYDDVKSESNTGDVEHLVPGEPTGSPGIIGNQIHFQNLTSSDITRESRSTCPVIDAPFPTTTDFSSTLLAENMDENPLFASHADERQLCGGEEQTQTLKNASNEYDMEQEKIRTGNNYSYPLEEFELTSDKVTDSGNAGNQDNLQNPTSSGITNEPESSCRIVSAPLPNTTDVLVTLPAENSYVNPPFASPLDKRECCGGKEESQAPEKARKECDTEQEEMGAEQNMWRLRSNRVEQILSALNEGLGPFSKSKKVGLEFNVGHGPKQNVSVDSLTNPVLLEIARFALAINSSQKDFIMEILEYNFELGLQNQHHRNIFACEIMNRIRQLSSCEDTVKLSNDVFELPGPMPSEWEPNRSGGSVIPEISDISRMEKCDVAPVCLDSQPETKEQLRSVDLYPSCKEMGLKLHISSCQPTKKMEIHKLTNAAMTEVTNFAEKLCGTFEKICLDIIRHNFDMQSGDSDPAMNILARIRSAMEQKNLSSFAKAYKRTKGVRKNGTALEKLDYQDDPNLDACSVSAITDQNVGSSADPVHQNAYNSMLWKLRANHIKQILSIPHQEHCPLYPYSRCKRLGIDLNVGSGVKQNLDPKLLTNGVMVELNTFATALLSARKYFVTEILEHNFDLDFKNKLYRSAFAQKTMDKIRSMKAHKRSSIYSRMNIPFKFPDMRCIQEPTYNKATYCPKCYKDQNHELCQNESEPAEANCSTQKPSTDVSSTFSATEEAIMDSYPHCKTIGLNLCVDKDQPKDKLDPNVLTRGIMMEVAGFAKKLCGTNHKVINDILDHNFNIMQSRDLNPSLLFQREMKQNDGGLAWFEKVFLFQQYTHRPPGYVSKVKREAAMHRSEWKVAIKKRRLALQTKEENATLPSHDMSVVKSKRIHQSMENCYPICTKIGLDLDVTLKSGNKEKLDLKLLTTAVVLEIHTFATQKVGHYYPRTVFNILDCNFDLSSQHYRRWEFSVATASKIQTTVEQYCENQEGLEEVFQLPFVLDPKASRHNEKGANSPLDIASKSESRSLGIGASFLTSTDVSYSLPTVNSNVNPPFRSQSDKKWLCGVEEQTQTQKTVPSDCDMGQEEMGTENYYTCPIEDSDLDSDEVTDSGSDGNQDHLKSEICFLSSDISSKSESSCLGICVPLLTTTDISSSLPSVESNMNPPFLTQHLKKELCGGAEQTQTPRYVPNECDMDQEEMRTEQNMWKLRSNRVEQILSALNEEFGPFNESKKVGLEFNVGFGPKQNISVDCLTDAVLLELVQFSLAINSSTKDFIMEIIEYNFDLGLQNQHHRSVFAYEFMNRVRQLRNCEDAVKFSDDVFELPGHMPSNNMPSQSVDSVCPELGSILSRHKCDVSPAYPPDSHAEIKEHLSLKSVDLYPSCKEISLKLHVKKSQPNKKLEINKLTNAVMTEVTNFAERLCGTFEQICLDILRHNFDLDLQSGDGDPAINILARIPTVMEEKSPSTYPKPHTKKNSTRKDISPMERVDCQNNLNVDACSAGSSEAASTDQIIGSSVDIEQQNEYNLMLWKLRANHIQKILSIPHHQEDCPLDPYSRCKKLGIDFNVGSGVKQNLDLELLTNGIMVELITFAKALLSAKKYFVTEILEHHFDLEFKNELYRRTFTQRTTETFGFMKSRKKFFSDSNMKRPYKLPKVTCVQEPTHDKTTYCSECYKDQNHELRQDESEPGHLHCPRPQPMTDTVSADAICTTLKHSKDLSSTFSATEEAIMDSYPHCKTMGLKLCVDNDQPKDKLDPNVLTRGIMMEVDHFARRVCGVKSKIIQALVEHNFNIDMQGQELSLMSLGQRRRKDGGFAWFEKVFVIHQNTPSPPECVSKVKREAAVHRSELKEVIKKRKLALETKEEKVTLPSHDTGVIKSKRKKWRINSYPICTEIGLDLDATFTAGNKAKLDLKLLTTAVVSEIHAFAIQKGGHYYPRTVFDILDCNFDLSSQHYRRWEFSVATASKVQTTVEQYYKNQVKAHEVFKLPFVSDPKALKGPVETSQNNKSSNFALDIATESQSKCLSVCAPFPTSSDISSTLLTVNSNVKPQIGSEPDKRWLCGGETQTQNPRNVPVECDMEQEEMVAENYYMCPLEDSDLDLDEITDSGDTSNQDQLRNPESCCLSFDVPRGTKSACLGVGAPFPSSTDVSSSSPSVNSKMDLPFVNQADERGLCGDEEKTAPRNAPIGCGLEQEKMRTEQNMWKLRSNRAEQILSALNEEFGPFNESKKAGLEFNVGFGPKQNISVDFLTNSVLLELAKFALAINSSQKDFIMEILEYNFDLGLQSVHDKNIFASEIMNRVRQLSSCEDAIKLSNKVFQLPVPLPSINTANQRDDSISPELRSTSRMGKCDVAPVCPESHADTKEHISCKTVAPYPSCKEIGLKLHVNNCQPTKKLKISKLTNAAMTEVTSFSDRLCGTFEQICLDILRHNFDLDLQSGNSELARNILARIPAAMEQSNLPTCVKAYEKIKGTRKEISTFVNLDCQNYPDLDAGSAGSSRSPIVDQDADSSADSESKKELDLNLWKLRANHIQHILSIPHQEHCPLYSYSRCKELGMDFNVGSGVKQNLDPKLLTNGVMVELNTFATALVSATKYYVTEILEYNFNLEFKNELYRSAFAQKVMDKIRLLKPNKRYTTGPRKKIPFELPDLRCIEETTYDKTTYCSKCYQEQNHKICQDESDPGHVHHPHPQTTKDTVSADTNCTTQKPSKDLSSSFSVMEGTIMDSYPLCKKIGLNLCVDSDQPKAKLDTCVLTRGIMVEVAGFAKRLCGTNHKLINDILDHNFNIMQSQDLNPSLLFQREMKQNDGGLAWFEKVFLFQQYTHRPPGYVSKVKREAAMHRSELKEVIKKRKLALETKEEKVTLPSHDTGVVKSKINTWRINSYPICTEIGLDLDMTFTAGNKEKLDLKLLTTAVVSEIHAFATQKGGHYYPRTVFNILDFNFDLSSQHYRRWEFSVAIASKVQTTVEQYCKNQVKAHEVFKLPFVSEPKPLQRFVETRQNNKSSNFALDIATESQSKCLSVCAPFPTSTDISSTLLTVNSNVNPPVESQSDKRWLCGGETQTQNPRNVPVECDMEQEEMVAENYYMCSLEESNLDSDEITDSGDIDSQDQLRNPKSCSLSFDVPRDTESACLGVGAPFPSFTDVSSSSPSVNSKMDLPFVNQADERGLCGDEEKPTPRNAPIESDMEQEKMRTEQNMWKLRSNRVEQIISAPNKEFGPFNESKKVGLEFNVGFGPKQNISVDFLTNSVLLELAKFALAINSSQKDFIMDILEYNFDLGLQSVHDKNIFASEIMNRVRQLSSCEDAIKLSNKVFQLPVPMPSINTANQSEDSVSPELRSTSRMGKCDVAPVCPESHADTKEHISCNNVAPYPLCKEIGLKLHVNNCQPTKKLKISKLTNAAMTEVTNFADKLCGTFEQICLDILRHNFDLDLQSGNSELARNILAQIPAAMEQRNLSTCVKAYKKVKGTRKEISTLANLDCQKNPNLDAGSAGSSQAAIVDQDADSSADSESKKELDLKLWKLRANHIQQILSIPHLEHCPLYSYSRCKKLGMDFNVGSGVKQNLGPKLLTNGIMVELNTFATELLSATEHFVTEILEYNFNLDLKDELYRSAFTQQTMDRIRLMNGTKRYSALQKKIIFELPDMRCIQDPTYDKTIYCPKCYQDRIDKLHRDGSDAGHLHHPRPQPMTDTVSADANCSTEKPSKDLSSTFSAMEEAIMDSYPLCKKIGLHLCVDRDQPKAKLDPNVLTRGIMMEVAGFSKRLCGTKSKIIHAVLEHNFSIGMQNRNIDLVQIFGRVTALKDSRLEWFDDIFVIPTICHRQPVHESKMNESFALTRNEMKEAIKKRKLALHTKEEKATLPSHDASVTKLKTERSRANLYPTCTEVGLDLDVTSKSEEKEKLNLNLLTTAVVVEIYKFATQNTGHYFPGTVFDILDYNFDLSSQHYRRWEFSLATASKIQNTVKRWRKKRDGADEVFKLPFVSPPKTTQSFVKRTKKEKEKGTNRKEQD